jgi:hypothetical protein
MQLGGWWRGTSKGQGLIWDKPNRKCRYYIGCYESEIQTGNLVGLVTVAGGTSSGMEAARSKSLNVGTKFLSSEKADRRYIK